MWYSPSIFLGPFVARVKARYRCRAYLILRDIFPQWSVEAGIMRKGIAYAVLRQVEKFQYRVADVIGVQARGNLSYFASGGDQPHPVVEVLQNWVHMEESVPVPNVSRRRATRARVRRHDGAGAGHGQYSAARRTLAR